jgi:WD40 repeat protein
METVTQLKLLTDVFLTHAWGVDELNRDNHERVATINDALKSTGFITWFDSERMTGDIADQMVTGIDNASVIIVFVTQRYMEKVNGSNANDNCRKEFKYAAQKKSSTKMIPVVMEPHMKDIRGSWTGLVQMELGNILYVDFSNDNDFQSAIQQLKAEILSRTNPLWVLRTSPLSPVSEFTTPPPPPGSGKATEADLLMIEQLSSWLNSLNISSVMSRRYAEIFVDKNTGSVAKLGRKLAKNSNYLDEIGGFDEDDIIDIKEGLTLSTASNIAKETKPADVPEHIANVTVSEMKSVIVLPSVEDTVTVPVVVSHSSVDNSHGSSGTDAQLPSFQNNIDQEGKAIPSFVSPLELQSSPNSPLNVALEVGFSAPAETESNEKIELPTDSRSGFSSPLFEVSVFLVLLALLCSRFTTIWNYSLEREIKDPYQTVTSISWNPVGNKIAYGTRSSTIKIWDGKSLKLLKTAEPPYGGVWSLSWNHDGSQIVSGSGDSTIKIWDSSTGRVLHNLRGHSSQIFSVAWSHDSSKIVSGSDDGTISIWSRGKSTLSNETAWLLLKTLNNSQQVFSVSCNHDVSANNTIKIWDSSTGRVLRTLIGHFDSVRSVSWSHDDSKIASGSYDKTVRIWNATTGALMKTLKGHSKSATRVAWSPDDRKIASCSYNEKKIIIWDAVAGQVKNSIQSVEGVRSVAWNGDGNEIVFHDGYKLKVSQSMKSYFSLIYSFILWVRLPSTFVFAICNCTILQYFLSNCINGKIFYNDQRDCIFLI